MITTTIRFGISIVTIAALAGAAPPPQPKAGDPLKELTSNQRLLFDEGLEYYKTPITQAAGLGPAFNQPSCAACHESPIGGWGATSVRHFARVTNGQFDFLANLGGPVLQRQAVSTACAENLPSVANHVRDRVTPSTLAFGMVEAIPDAAIIALEDTNDANGDGISGRAHRVQPIETPTGPLRVGRFGWKAQIATVLSFSGDAARTEMGFTNRVVPTETAPNGDNDLLGQCDPILGIEDQPDSHGLTFVDAVTAFQRYLAPPPQAPRGGMAGEVMFSSIGCAKCHTPSFVTSSSVTVEQALRGKTINVFSDFLLHDMGSLADGIPDGQALPTEMKTPPLWNLRTRPVMLHDGSAAQANFSDRVTTAIVSHAGEGFASRNAYLSLSSADRNSVIAFLDSLGRDDYDFDGDGQLSGADFGALVMHANDTDVSPDEAWAVGDLNQNRRLDADEIAQLATILGLPTDCNQNSVADWQELLAGTATDSDENGRPDECDVPSCTLKAIQVTGQGGTISDSPAPALVRTITIPQQGIIQSIRLTLRVQHSWVNDLIITLKRGNDAPLQIHGGCGIFHDIDGTYVFTDSTWNGANNLASLCSGPLIDRGGSNSETRFLITPGTYRPTPLQGFAAIRNKQMAAAWTLSIIDIRSNDAGVLNDWSMEIRYQDPSPADCDGDGTADCQQLDNNPTLDCDSDGVPDSCQLTGHDCDGSGTLDRCQVAAGTAADCDGNGRLDSCESDLDADGVPDACDGCPNNAGLIVPGPCGCGSTNGDDDFDGTPNCSDGCPNDSSKTSPGVCGCNVADTDSDGDGAANCNDGCPSDASKVNPGACGCGTPDTDSDGDGSPDCIDGCPSNPAKTSPGACGCATSDIDSDSDGVPNCIDGCPSDSAKTAPGVCGCGSPDIDSDGDTIPDCIDNSNEVARLVETLDPTAPSIAGQFGKASASDGVSVLVGAPLEKIGSTTNAGSAYVFAFDNNGLWTAPQRLLAPVAESGSEFGGAVAISGDIAVIGARISAVGSFAAAGKVYVYRRVAGVWTIEATLTASVVAPEAKFGSALAIASGRIVVGTPEDQVTGGGSVAVYERIANTWTKVATLVATDLSQNDFFGSAVAASENVIAVGAQRADVGGVFDRGAAYVFKRASNGTWSQQAKLEPPSTTTGDVRYPSSLSIQANRIIAGANKFGTPGALNRGKAFIFSSNGDTWTAEATLIAPDGAAGDGLGFSVALDATATRAVVSLPEDTVLGTANAGSCRVFKRTGTQWAQEATITGVDSLPGFGFSVVMCGDIAAISSPASSAVGLVDSGRVYLFDTAPLDCDGDGVADADIDGDGIADCSDRDDDNDGTPDSLDLCRGDLNKVAPGQCGCGIPDTDSDLDGIADCNDGCPNDSLKTAPGQCGCGTPDTDSDGDGTADCVDSSGLQVASMTAQNPAAFLQFGWNVAVDGDTAIGGAPQANVGGAANTGTATIFRRGGDGTWMTVTTLTAPDGAAGDRFGTRVAIEGDKAVISAPQVQGGKGAAYVFQRSQSGAWNFVARLQPSDISAGDEFGSSVAVSANLIAVGAPESESGPNAGAGIVYIFASGQGTLWTQEARLTASGGAIGDRFGSACSLAAGLLCVGAPLDDATGAVNAGSVYVFRRTAPNVWAQRAKLTASVLSADAQFGRDVATDGATLAVCAPSTGNGAAYVSTVSGPSDVVSAPIQLFATGIVASDGFGSSIGVSGNRIAIGAARDDVADQADAGSVRIFTRGMTSEWSYSGIIVSPNGATGDLFGGHLAIDGDVVAVGAVGASVGALQATGTVSIFDLSPLDCNDDGVPDVDSDSDGAADCNDLDDDNDGTPDTLDGCQFDPLKTTPGTCGCGVVDSAADTDADGVINCIDNCPAVANANQADCDADGLGNACESQVDCNSNGVIDSCDVISGGTSPDYNANFIPDECESASLMVPQEFSTMQAAIDAAPNNGIIIVGPGTYIGAINARGKAVKIHALFGPAVTVIDGASVNVSLVTFNSNEGPATVFSGFTVRRGVRGTPVVPGSPFLVGGGIFVSGSSPTITNCVIEQCRGQFGAGIYLFNSSAVLRECAIISNTAVEYGGGVQGFRCVLTLENCQVINNVSGIAGGGMHLAGGQNRLIDCAILDNATLGSGGGVSWDSDSYGGPISSLIVVDSFVDNNFAVNAGGGAYIWSFNQTPRTAVFSSSRICGNVPDEYAGPIALESESVVCADCNLNGIPDSGDIAANPSLDCNGNGRIDSCDVLSGAVADRNGNGIPDECEESIRFVPSEYPTIGAATAAAVSGDVVWISPGTYSETINVHGKGITVRGGGPGVIIDGASLSDSLLVAKSGEGLDTVIDGLTFRNGRVGSTLIGNPSLRVGGGAYIESASPTIRNCTFEQCRAQFGGGGYFYAFNGLVDSCTFRFNTALEDGGGLQLFDGASDGRAVITNCLFVSNVSGNHGGALHLVSVGGHTLQDCIIRQNQAQLGFGGGISWFRYGQIPSVPDPLVVDGCVIEENIAGASGGGIFVHNLPVAATIRDSVVCQNLPSNVTGSIFNDGGNNFCNCLGDINHDGFVNGSDLAGLLSGWGTSGSSDIDGDGTTGGSDLATLLSGWGTCPQ